MELKKTLAPLPLRSKIVGPGRLTWVVPRERLHGVSVNDRNSR